MILVSCDPGYEDVNGLCVECQIGYYKIEKKASSCTKCQSGFITASTGSTNQNACNVRKYNIDIPCNKFIKKI